MLKFALLVLLALAPSMEARATAKPLPLAAAESGAKAHPADAEAWIQLARSRIAAGKAKSAIDAAERAIALAPRNAQAHYWLGNAYGNRMGDVGMLGKLGLAPKLRDAFEQAIALDPSHIKARAAMVEYDLLAPSMLGGGVDKARAQAREIGKRDAARGLLAQARIAAHEKDDAAALKAYRAALAAAPTDPEVQYTVAMALVYDERTDEALALLRKVVASKPEEAGAWYQIGRAAATSGKHLEEGAAALQRYLSMPQERGEPERKHALYRLGQIQAQAGDRAKARASWRQALALDPDFEEAKAELAKG